MITFSPFLRNRPAGEPDPLADESPAAIEPHNALSIMLKGIALYAPPSTDGDMRALLDSIADLSEEIHSDTTPERAAIIAGAAVRALRDHAQSVSDLLDARAGELDEMRQIVQLMAAFVNRSGLANRAAASTIDEIMAATAPGTRGIGGKGASGAHSGDLTALGAKLVESFERSLDSIRRFASTSGSITDDATGLPGPAAAVSAFAAAWSQRKGCCAVVFGIERMDSINARFGFAAGDELLRSLSRHLTANLGPGDRLYRWRGPHLAALIERDIASGSPWMEVSRIASWGNEHPITVRNREAFVSASALWDLFPLGVFAGVEDLVASMNDFAASGQQPVSKQMRQPA